MLLDNLIIFYSTQIQFPHNTISEKFIELRKAFS